MAPPRPLAKLLLLLLGCLAVYLIGNDSVPLWDRDEPRLAQTSRQMLQSGDWAVPRLYDSVRTAKPPLIYWVQAISMKLIGSEGNTGVFAARLPSALAMVLTLGFLATVLWRYVTPDHALWTVLILSTCALVVLAAKSALTDSVLLLFVTVAQVGLYLAWQRRACWGVTVGMSVAIALALLTKGPVAIGIQAMTVVGLGVFRLTLPKVAVLEPIRSLQDRTRLTLRVAAKVVVALLIILAIGLPWVYLVGKRYPQFIHTALSHEIKDRAAGGLEGHKGWPGYYLVSIWATFLPWSLILPMALVMGWKNRRDPRVRFALAAIAGPCLMFEIVQTKLPHYLLPCFPPLAFLAADAIVGRPSSPFARRNAGRSISLEYAQPVGTLATSQHKTVPWKPTGTVTERADLETSVAPFTDTGFKIGVVVWVAVAFLLALVPWLAVRWFRPLPWLAMSSLTMAAVIYAGVTAALFISNRSRTALASMGVGMLAMTCVIFGSFLPSVPFLRLSSEVARVLRTQNAVGPGQVLMLDYKEPSLAFYQGGTIREGTQMVATDALLDKSPQWLVMTVEVYNAPRTDRDRLEIIARFKGLDLSSSMRATEVLVVRKTR